jgi:hypothetical protein
MLIFPLILQVKCKLFAYPCSRICDTTLKTTGENVVTFHCPTACTIYKISMEFLTAQNLF